MIHFPFLSATVLSKQWLDWCPLEFPLHWCKTQPLLTQREFHSFSSLMAVWSFGKPTQMIPEKFLTIFTIPMSPFNALLELSFGSDYLRCWDDMVLQLLWPWFKITFRLLFRKEKKRAFVLGFFAKRQKNSGKVNTLITEHWHKRNPSAIGKAKNAPLIHQWYEKFHLKRFYSFFTTTGQIYYYASKRENFYLHLIYLRTMRIVIDITGKLFRLRLQLKCAW